MTAPPQTFFSADVRTEGNEAVRELENIATEMEAEYSAFLEDLGV